MASRYWVGGTDSWDGLALLKWSTTSGGIGGAAEPTSADDVFFDANSGSGTVTTSGGRSCLALNFSGFTGTFAGSSSVSCYASLTCGSGMTWSHTGFLNFNATSGTNTVTSNGKTISSKLYFGGAGVGATFQVADAMTLDASASPIEVAAGTFDLNGQNLTTPSFKSNDNTLARTLTLGSGTITLNSSGAVWQMDATNLTVSATTGTIKFTDTTSTDKTFQGVGKTWGTLWNATTSTGNVVITGANTFGGLRSDVGRYWTFPAATTTTLSAASGWNMTGSAGNLITIISSSGGSAATLSCSSGKISSNYLSLKDSTATGGAVFFAGANTTNVSGNTGWLFETSLYDKTISATGGNYSASTAWVEGSVPAATDNVGTYSGSGNLTITGGAVCRSFDMNGYTGTVTHNSAATFTIGDGTSGTGNIALRLVSGMTYTLNNASSSAITFASTSATTQTITLGTKTLGSVNINGVGGTFQLQDSLTLSDTATLTLTNGTIDANNQNLSVGLFNSSFTNTRTITMGSGTWTITGVGTIWNTATTTGLTFNANTSTINLTNASASDRTITFGSLLLNHLTISAGSGGLTTTGLLCNNLNFSGYTGAWAVASITVSGNLTMGAGMTVTDGSSNITMNATSGTKTITGNSVSIGRGLIFDGVGGTFQCADNLTVASTRSITLTNGTFDTNAKSVSSGSFNSSNSNTRTLTMTNSTWTLTATGTAWNITTATNLTLNASGSTINATEASASARTLTFNSAVTMGALSISAGSGTQTITNFIGTDLNFTGYTGAWASSAITLAGSLTMGTGMTVTGGANAITMSATSGTKTITSNSVTIDRPLTFNGVGGTWQLADNAVVGSTRTVTLTNGTIDANNKNFSMGLFSSSNSNTRVITMGSGIWTITGNNATVWTTSTSTNLTITPGASTLDFNYSGATGTRTIITSTATTARVGNVTISAGTDTVSLTSLTCSGLNFTGFAGTWSGSGALNTVGNVVISTGLTRSYTGAMTFANTSGTKTFTSNGKSFASALTMNGVGGTVQFADAFSSTSSITLTNGTIDANNQTVAASTFSSSNSNTRVLLMGTQTWSLSGTGTVWNLATSTGMTLTPSTSTIKMTAVSGATCTFAGGGLTYNNLWIAAGAEIGIKAITGNNTFNDLKDDGTLAHQLRFDNGGTNTVTTFTVNGNAGQLITVRSVTGGVTHNLVKTGGGTISCNYITPTDSVASPASTWYALLTNGCTDGGNNTGWNFTSYSTAPSMFMVF